MFVGSFYIPEWALWSYAGAVTLALGYIVCRAVIGEQCAAIALVVLAVFGIAVLSEFMSSAVGIAATYKR